MVAKRRGLVSARKAAGLTQEKLAAELSTYPSTVFRWEAGITEPALSTRPKLARLLGVTRARLEELLREGLSGASETTSELAPLQKVSATASASVTAPQYQSSLERTLINLTAVAGLDDASVAGFHGGTFTDELPAQAILQWLISTDYDDVRPSGGSTTLRDVDEIMTTTTALDQLDRQFGGDYSRGLAAKYLSGRVLPLLRKPSSGSVRRDLFQAAAVLCEVIGYMAYDGQLHVLAQHYFVHALRLSKEAGNPTYGSFVLATMSHQALYLNRPDHALTLAQAAQHRASAATVPAVATEAAMLEAVAHAELGNRTESTQSLGRAELSFHRHSSADDTPYWMAHWDDAVFASFASSVWLGLGDPAGAAPYLDVLWGTSQQQVRRQVFAAGQMATAALLEREVEHAVHYGNMAVEAAAAAKSKRSHRIVRDLIIQLDGYQQLAPVRELTSKAVALLPSEAL